MNFLSDLQKKANSSSETHLPEEKNSSSETLHPEEKDDQNQNQNQHQHRQPSNAELMASAKVLAESGQTTLSQGASKVDKARAAEAASDLLEAASSYGKLEEKSYGKYVEKAETYLDQYGNSSSKSQSHSTTTTTTPSHSSTPSTTTDSKPHSAAGGGDRESEGNTESGTGDYVKMAQGVTSNYIAELWAMRDGFTLCLHRNFPAVIIELDAKAGINVISNPNQPNSIISSIVNDCHPFGASCLHGMTTQHCKNENPSKPKSQMFSITSSSCIRVHPIGVTPESTTSVGYSNVKLMQFVFSGHP
ncbi:hypothetical protein SO802_011308 [Lithocarpus litseifolius]|uniref:RNase H type-1 domain-containing protein n=1 Tax=Lithocarpus litseifolius TaxID=425828 RepID=A0AAW2D087_9ROSI